MSEKPLIVALVGEPGAGRSALATALQAQGFARLTFNDAARAEVAAAWRIDVRMLTDRHTASWPLQALAVGQCSDSAFVYWAAHCEESLTEARSPEWLLREWTAYRDRSKPGYFTAIVARGIAALITCGFRRVVLDEVSERPGVAAMLESIAAKVLRVHRPQLANAAQVGQVLRQRHALAAHGDVLNDGSLLALAEAGAEAVEALA